LIGIVVGLEAEARIARRFRLDVLVAVGGGSAEGARRAAERLLAQGATGLVSFGFAGGLSPDLAAGALVVPRRVMVDGRAFACDPGLGAQLGGFTPHDLLHSERVVATAGEKAALYRHSGCAAIDMESGALARAALAESRPFAVLRAVCDPAWQSLPPAALLAIAADGQVALGRVLRSVLNRPRQVTALIALARDSGRARRALRARVALVAGSG
jgi:hopanoid-associated phosphorylase